MHRHTNLPQKLLSLQSSANVTTHIIFGWEILKISLTIPQFLRLFQYQSEGEITAIVTAIVQINSFMVIFLFIHKKMHYAKANILL